MDPKFSKQLGEFLIEQKLITPEDLELALKEQAKTRELLGNIIARLKFSDRSDEIYPMIAQYLGVPYVSLRDKPIASDVINRIPAQLACYYKIVPVEWTAGELRIATNTPHDIHHTDGLAAALADRIQLVLASERDILDAIRTYYGVGAETIERMMDTIAAPVQQDLLVEDIKDIDSEASIGRFLNQLLFEAYKDRATDIHIEPYEDQLQIRYRIDGELYDAKVPANIKHFKDSINSRIKILSNLNIAEKRLPQDGRFKVKVGEVQLDLRVSFLPTSFGESVVLRLLNQNQLFEIRELGFLEDDLKILDHLIQQPHGIVFVTGPTGSGKTTTLYSCLSRINTAEKKIITIEDPVEYQLKGITQIQVNPAIGLTFAQGLRSMLRHDPDIMMVGEVRDQETAQISVQVALTGHLVFSTLHTNDAASGATRLLDMGIEPFLISSSVLCFIAQRLVRVLCPKCRVQIPAPDNLEADFGVTAMDIRATTFYGPKGCESCQGTGYHGRKGIYEILLLDEDLRALIHRQASADQLRRKALEKKVKTLRMDGWEKVKLGMTTPEEVIRATQE